MSFLSPPIDAILLAFLVSLLTTEIVIYMAHRFGWLCYPQADRWHQHPTALYGGVAIVAAFGVGFVLLIPTLRALGSLADVYGLIIGSALIFLLGLRDDVRAFNPQVKLIGQVLAITVFAAGVSAAHMTPQFVLLIPLAVFWVLGITNALNLLDNMDGLCAGIAFVASVIIAAFCLQVGLFALAILSLVIGVSALGFLCFNFHPARSARIFMGDCGSMFLGFSLSALVVVVAGRLHTDRVDAWIVPVLIMAVPIFDTTLVTIRRKAEGRAISQGGRDHSSHRLVYAGLSEKQTVIAIWSFGGITGGTGLVLWALGNPMVSLFLGVLFAVFLWWIGVFLSRFPCAREEVAKAAMAWEPL